MQRSRASVVRGHRILKSLVTVEQHRKLQAIRLHQAKYYNQAARDLPELRKGDVFRMYKSRDNLKENNLLKAEVPAKVGIRSYQVLTEDGS